MARVQNIQLIATARFRAIVGPDIEFVPDSSSGAFAAIVHNGVGDYTVTMQPGWLIAPDAVIDATLEEVVGTVNAHRTAQNTIAIEISDGAQAVDLAFNLSVEKIYQG